MSQDVKCPVTDKPIFVDIAALSREGPTRFKCPVCGRIHELHAIDHRVISNRLLPSRLAIAMFTAPMRSAAMVTTSSGRDVAPATNSEPTKVNCQPIASARSEPTKDSQMPAATTIALAIANRSVADCSEISG
jgi:predicted RNA-binding Zn-ribbon protein involved in translation (DUF1610 family)